jgi:excisionase family DNA binding protein
VSVAAPLEAASVRLRDVPGFPRRRGRPRKVTTSAHPTRKKTGPAPTPFTALPPLEAAVLPRAVPTSTVFAESRPTLPPRLLGARDGGAYLGVSAWTLRQLIKKRRLRPVVLPGTKRLLVDRADLDELIEGLKSRRRRRLRA